MIINNNRQNNISFQAQLLKFRIPHGVPRIQNIADDISRMVADIPNSQGDRVVFSMLPDFEEAGKYLVA